MFIDLRSDTVTKPTKGMLDAMFSAQVGDDVFDEDPTVKALEEKAANMFGVEAALFCASGTMTNQLAIKAQTVPAQEVICDKYAHIYYYEGGGLMANAGLSVSLLDGQMGRFTAEQVKLAINHKDDFHRPISRIVAVENTMNKGGGSIYDFKEFHKIKSVCQDSDLIFHIDGARLFNALVETEQTPADYGKMFDSISICLSKGLGCPVGSILLGSNDLIKKATRIRKMWGGGWRQAGNLAAAGIFALDNHVLRLKEDHVRAKLIASEIKQLSYIKSVYPTESNIVIFEVEGITEREFVAKAREVGIGCFQFGPQLIRFVTHLDFNDDQLSGLIKKLKSFRI